MAKQKKTVKSAICFLCKDLHKETYSFGTSVAEKLNIPVYFVVDSSKPNDFELKNKENVFIVRIADSVCVGSGFQNCMITGGKVNTVLQKNPISYDKMLYYFCKIELTIDFLFVFEDDVFIPFDSTVNNLLAKYSHFDLVTPNNLKKEDDVMDWHWNSVVDKVDSPYYYSMVSAFGLSRKMLNVINKQVETKGTLFFTEVMFNTLAMQNELKVTDAFELKSVVWMGEWGIDEFLLLPNNVFHPKKDLDNFVNYRAGIIVSRENKKYKPKNNLPPFIKDLM
jgi:hypothetical protein